VAKKGRPAKRRRVFAPQVPGVKRGWKTGASGVEEDRRQYLALIEQEKKDSAKRTHREAAKIYEAFRALAWQEGDRVSSGWMKIGV
jgi:hypothetical protein